MREIVAERTSDALQHLKRQGVRYGQVPFGYQLGLDGIALEEDEEQQAVIGRMVSWRRAGATLREIVARLTADGIATANGGQWWPATVKSVLATSGVTA